VRYTLIDNIIPGVERILNYSFANKNVLLEALTHRKFGYGNLEINYEKLEVLGDAILDYIANSNLIKYTMFEKYNIEERKNQKYIMPEDFKPFDAHQAKSHLTKNDFLAKLVVLTGLHEYILFEKPVQPTFQKSLEMEVDWKSKKDLQEKLMESEIDKFILYSFKKNFSLNNRDVELVEPSKILGDVFEAIIGAVFIDAGGDMDTLLEVFKYFLCPFILYVAKYSK
jgi:endoribonuclease Dicer